ncbi:MAG: hypothetical protein ACKO81_08440, partial [Planctomycetota bacterium]
IDLKQLSLILTHSLKNGCSRTLRETGSELKLAPRVSNRPKPAKTGLEMQKAESGHPRLSVLTG